VGHSFWFIIVAAAAFFSTVVLCFVYLFRIPRSDLCDWMKFVRD
jgi:hypothetical protein